MRSHSDMIDYSCLQANQLKCRVGSEKTIGNRYHGYCMLLFDGGIVWKVMYRMVCTPLGYYAA